MPGPVHDPSQAFQQLEAVMLRQMLRASGAFRASDSPGAQLRTDMFVETLADAVAKAGGLGIAALLERQIGGASSPAAAASTTVSLASPAGVDDLDDPNSSAPLPEDPSAPSIDDFQPARAAHAPRAAAPSGEVTTQVTSGFGMRVHPLTGDHRFHTGVDLRAQEGVPIRAAAAGVVREAGQRGGYGNAVEVDHGDGTSTLYAHASALLVTPGQRVERGEPLGLVGHTGQTTGPHLHFELRRNGHPVNPGMPGDAAPPIPIGRALNRYRGRVEDPVGGTPSSAEGGKS